MQDDDLEFLISQHFDGTLAADETARLESLLANDAAARRLFDQHATLDGALRASRIELAIDSNWLSEQIADRIDHANARSFRWFGWSSAIPLVLAACLMIGLALGVIFLPDEGTYETVALKSTPTPAAPLITEVSLGGPEVEPAATTGFAEISVGVPANLTPSIVAALYLSHDLSDGHVSVHAAGRRAAEVFE